MAIQFWVMPLYLLGFNVLPFNCLGNFKFIFMTKSVYFLQIWMSDRRRSVDSECVGFSSSFQGLLVRGVASSCLAPQGHPILLLLMVLIVMVTPGECYYSISYFVKHGINNSKIVYFCYFEVKLTEKWKQNKIHFRYFFH